MATYKNLHLANNITALDLLANNHGALNSVKKFDHMCKLLDKLYKEAQQEPLDQEKTYILLTRYLQLYDRLWNNQSDKKFVEIRFGSDYKKVLMQYNELKASLIKRYEQVNETKPDPVAPAPQPGPSSAAKSTRIFYDEFITCPQLYSALQRNCNMLLVDARPEDDFKQSRVDVPNVINVPQHCITAGLSANALGKKLVAETLAVWDKRDSYGVLVLFDWNTTAENFQSTKLDQLRSALVNWDCNRNYNEKPVVLNGGYLEILQMYPTTCLNPHVYLSKRNNELDELLDIDNIEYPTEGDSKAPVMGLSNSKPRKEIAATYRDEATRNNLVKENKKISLDVKETISKLLEAETEWKKINDASNQETNANTLEELKSKETEVQDEIVKLEKSLNKLNKEKKHIQKKFDLYANFDPQNQTVQSAEIEEIMKIEKDDSEKLKILEVIAEERCKALQKARALKPKNESDSSANNNGATSRLRPKSTVANILRPLINRATKPGRQLQLSKDLVGPLEHIAPGRVGLKNIRNTCYMNTVIQCFRNVPAIMQLFCTGRYAQDEIRKPAALIYETAFLIRYLWSNVVKYIEPYEFYQKVCTLEPSFGLGNHEDSMEFFLFLLNHLSEDCTYDIDRPTVMTPRQKAWYTQFQGKNSVFIDLFYHQIRIQQFCPSCLSSTFKFEMESTFMLSVPKHDFNLEHLMKEYMADYVINDYCCSKCKKPVMNRKKVCYEPKIVVIVLKRQIQLDKANTFKKNEAKGYFQKDNFRVGNCFYKLNSIAMHSGDVNYGHYTAACLIDKTWYEFNDENVKPININDDSIKSKACAFFYSMCDDNVDV